MSLDRTIAHFVTHRRPVVLAAVGAILVACLLVIVFGLRFNSDILDLLPKDFDSVQAFKTTDREFTNARQITFALSSHSPRMRTWMTSRVAFAMRCGSNRGWSA